jgi:predicted Zn-dependent protease
VMSEEDLLSRLKQEQTITNQQEKISQLEMNASHSDSDSESDSDSDIEEKQENNTLKAKNLSPQLKEDVNGR